MQAVSIVTAVCVLFPLVAVMLSSAKELSSVDF